jgi:hypothetical protein
MVMLTVSQLLSLPQGRAGYLRWREDLKKFHARTVVGLMREAGYSEAAQAKVGGCQGQGSGGSSLAVLLLPAAFTAPTTEVLEPVKGSVVPACGG